MGVYGLLKHCENSNIGTLVDLFHVSAEENGIELVIDYCGFFMEVIDHASSHVHNQDSSWLEVTYLGGEYDVIDSLVTNFCRCLSIHRITPVFFDDGPRGSDPEQYEKKMETWKERYEGCLDNTRGLSAYLKNMCDIDQLSMSPPWMAQDQTRLTLRRCISEYGGKFVTCKGEADDVMAKYLHDTPQAYAILGNDSDFCVMKNCRFIAMTNFNWRSVLYTDDIHGKDNDEQLYFDKEHCMATVYTTENVWKSLGLLNHEELVNVAALTGNDFTKPLLRQIWKDRKSLRDITMWYKGHVPDNTNLEDCPQFTSMLSKASGFKEAIEYSRRFYNQEDVTSQRLMETNGTESTLKKYIVEHISNHQFATATLAWHEGIHWGGYIMEDLLLPSIDDWNTDFRCFLYSMCTDKKVITVHCRTNKRNLDTQKLTLRHYKWLPKAHEISLLDRERRWRLFDCITGHLEHNVTHLVPEQVVNGEDIHNFSALRGVRAGFLIHCVHYLMTLTYVNKFPVDAWEFVALLATALHCEESTEDHSSSSVGVPVFKPVWKKPTMRCLTLGNWYQYVVKGFYQLSRILLVSEDFPEPQHAFQGTYYTSLYMTLKEKGISDDYIDPEILEILNDIVEENEVFDKETKCEMKNELGFSDMPVDCDSFYGSEDEEKPQESDRIRKDPNALPIDAHKEEILAHISKYRVTCIQGETGSGKSTKVPQFILQDYYDVRKEGFSGAVKPRVIVTQPRRLAAKTLACRVAREMGDREVGHRVGYKIGQDHTGHYRTEILYVTTGYLIELLVHNPERFNAYTHVILDEIHERDLDADLMSLIVHLLMKTYTNPKVIIMSATMQAKLFVSYFAESSSRAASMKQHLVVDVSTPYRVKDMFIEDLIEHYEDTLTQDCQFRLLRLFCQFYGISINEVIDNADAEEKKHNENSGFTKMKDVANGLLDDGYIKERDLHTKPRGKVAMDRYTELTVPLIQAVTRPGESILLFLPGKKEIEEIHDLLVCYEDRVHAGWPCTITLFTLHSSIPFEDQQQCFELPGRDTCHVILATNIAESSLTLPRVSVIMDFGMRRMLVYDVRKRVRCLQTGWCSQASMLQRRGRTGRVCDGVCIRMMTRQHFQDQPEFDEPQMRIAPLDKLLLQVKYVGSHIAPERRPSELLSQAIQPPNLDNIGIAVKNLADIGALTAEDECADVTLLGELAMHLPLDLHLCRLIFFGCLFNCPCDAIVMAAALQTQDPFTLPSKKVSKDQQRFISSQRASFACRRHFDNKTYSEPIMCRNLYKTWLRRASENPEDNRELYTKYRSYNQLQGFTRESRPTAKDIPKLREAFCHENCLMYKRFLVLEGFVYDLANTILKSLPKDSENYGKVQHLLSIMPGKGRRNVTTANRSAFDASKPQSPRNNEHTQYKLCDLFTGDVLRLNAILAAALAPRFIHGSVQEMTEKGGGGKMKMNKTEKLQKQMEDAGVNPEKGVCINNMPDWLLGDELILKDVVRCMSLMDEDFGENKQLYRRDKRASSGCTSEFKLVQVQKEKKLFIEYVIPIMPEKCTDPRKDITSDLHYSVHHPYQFTENGKGADFQMELPTDRAIAKNSGEKYVRIGMPQNPFRIEWSLMSSDGIPLRQGARVCKTVCSWRNPIGFACDVEKREHFGVTATFTKGFNGMMGWADGVSLFPTYQDNLYSIILMLMFIPDQYGVSFTLDTNRMAIHEVEIFEYRITVPSTYPLTKKIIKIINEIRKEISDIFIDKEASNHKIIPNSKMVNIYGRLLKEMSKEDKKKSAAENKSEINQGNSDVENDPDEDSFKPDEKVKINKLPYYVKVNAFDVSQIVTGKKKKAAMYFPVEVWEDEIDDGFPSVGMWNNGMNDIQEEEIGLKQENVFNYLVPYDGQIFSKKAMCGYHSKKDSVLDVEEYSSTSSSSTSSSSEGEDIEEISVSKPSRLINMLKSEIVDYITQQTIPVIQSMIWKIKSIKDILEQIDEQSRISGSAFNAKRYFEELKSGFIFGELNDGIRIVCAKNLMGNTLWKLIDGKDRTTMVVLTTVYYTLLKEDNRSQSIKDMSQLLRKELSWLNCRDRIGVFQNLLYNNGEVFQVKWSEAGKLKQLKVKLQNELFEGIVKYGKKGDKENEEMNAEKRGGYTVESSFHGRFKKDGRDNCEPQKLSETDVKIISDELYTHLMGSDNIPLPLEKFITIKGIRDVLKLSDVGGKMKLNPMMTKDWLNFFAFKYPKSLFQVDRLALGVNLLRNVYNDNVRSHVKKVQHNDDDDDDDKKNPNFRNDAKTLQANDVSDSNDEELNVSETVSLVYDHVIDIILDMIEEVTEEVILEENNDTVTAKLEVSGVDAFMRSDVELKSNAEKVKPKLMKDNFRPAFSELNNNRVMEKHVKKSKSGIQPIVVMTLEEQEFYSRILLKIVQTTYTKKQRGYIRFSDILIPGERCQALWISIKEDNKYFQFKDFLQDHFGKLVNPTFLLEKLVYISEDYARRTTLLPLYQFSMRPPVLGSNPSDEVIKIKDATYYRLSPPQSINLENSPACKALWESISRVIPESEFFKHRYTLRRRMKLSELLCDTEVLHNWNAVMKEGISVDIYTVIAKGHFYVDREQDHWDAVILDESVIYKEKLKKNVEEQGNAVEYGEICAEQFCDIIGKYASENSLEQVALEEVLGIPNAEKKWKKLRFVKNCSSLEEFFRTRGPDYHIVDKLGKKWIVVPKYVEKERRKKEMKKKRKKLVAAETGTLQGDKDLEEVKGTRKESKCWQSNKLTDLVSYSNEREKEKTAKNNSDVISKAVTIEKYSLVTRDISADESKCAKNQNGRNIVDTKGNEKCSLVEVMKTEEINESSRTKKDDNNSSKLDTKTKVDNNGKDTSSTRPKTTVRNNVHSDQFSHEEEEENILESHISKYCTKVPVKLEHIMKHWVVQRSWRAVRANRKYSTIEQFLQGKFQLDTDRYGYVTVCNNAKILGSLCEKFCKIICDILRNKDVSALQLDEIMRLKSVESQWIKISKLVDTGPRGWFNRSENFTLIEDINKKEWLVSVDLEREGLKNTDVKTGSETAQTTEAELKLLNTIQKKLAVVTTASKQGLLYMNTVKNSWRLVMKEGRHLYFENFLDRYCHLFNLKREGGQLKLSNLADAEFEALSKEMFSGVRKKDTQVKVKRLVKKRDKNQSNAYDSSDDDYHSCGSSASSSGKTSIKQRNVYPKLKSKTDITLQNKTDDEKILSMVLCKQKDAVDVNSVQATMLIPIHTSSILENQKDSRDIVSEDTKHGKENILQNIKDGQQKGIMEETIDSKENVLENTSHNNVSKKSVLEKTENCKEIVLENTKACKEIVVENTKDCKEIVVENTKDCKEIVVENTKDCKEIVVENRECKESVLENRECKEIVLENMQDSKENVLNSTKNNEENVLKSERQVLKSKINELEITKEGRNEDIFPESVISGVDEVSDFTEGNHDSRKNSEAAKAMTGADMLTVERASEIDPGVYTQEPDVVCGDIAVSAEESQPEEVWF